MRHVTTDRLKCASGIPQNFSQYPNGCSSSYFPDQNCCCYASPVVIDAFGEGFHLTSALGGVKFTTLPTDGLDQISWTDARWHNGWLALDRNGNGTIDNLTELFGNLTSQPSNDEPNGYLALAVFDDPANGGNGNGAIDPGDSVYDHLLLWIDANHNGVSEPGELQSLRQVGIFKIDLRFRDSGYSRPACDYEPRTDDRCAPCALAAVTLQGLISLSAEIDRLCPRSVDRLHLDATACERTRLGTSPYFFKMRQSSLHFPCYFVPSTDLSKTRV